MTERGPICAICHDDRLVPAKWFLVIENRWQDRLKIIHWNTLWAAHPGAHGVCGSVHLIELVTRWMTGSLDQLNEVSVSSWE